MAYYGRLTCFAIIIYNTTLTENDLSTQAAHNVIFVNLISISEQSNDKKIPILTTCEHTSYVMLSILLCSPTLSVCHLL